MASDGLLLTLRVLTFVTALAVGLSPYPEIRRVHKQRDASEVSIFPVVTLFGNSYLWMIYSYLIGNFFPLFSVAPLETLKRIIRTKNASSMPVTMSIVAFINGLLWVWTSALQDDMYVLSTNAVGTALGGVQIIVYVIYRPGKIEDAALRPTTGRVDSDHPRPKSEQAIVYALEADTKNERSKSAVFVEVKSPL
ncbi:hypothetical protein PRIC2_004682 [Phytophthora ramorum]